MSLSLVVLKLSSNNRHMELSSQHLVVGRSWGLLHNFGITEARIFYIENRLFLQILDDFNPFFNLLFPQRKVHEARQHSEYYSNAYEIIHLQHFSPSSFVTNDLTILKTWHKLFFIGMNFTHESEGNKAWDQKFFTVSVCIWT